MYFLSVILNIYIYFVVKENEMSKIIIDDIEIFSGSSYNEDFDEENQIYKFSFSNNKKNIRKFLSLVLKKNFFLKKYNKLFRVAFSYFLSSESFLLKYKKIIF